MVVVVVLMVLGAAFEVAFGNIWYAMAEIGIAVVAVWISAVTRMDFARMKAPARYRRVRRSR